MSALYLGYAPPPLQPPEPLLTFARFADIPHLVFVWLFALSLFETDFKLRTVHWLAGVFYCAPIVWLRLHYVGLLPPLPAWFIPYGIATSALLMAHLCYATIRGRMDDLLEARRSARIYFVIVVTAVAVAAAMTDLMPDGAGPVDKRTAKVIAIWPAIVWGAIWMLAFRSDAVRFVQTVSRSAKTEARDRALRKALDAEMSEREAFRDPELTIVRLAARLGVNQHRLRALINQGLGYENFGAFINTYRIDAVKAALASPDKAEQPILRIAMDAGFKSLSPFNKAFRDRVGTTPTAYRKSCLGSAPPD